MGEAPILVDECDACGVDVVAGVPHDCPVLGTTVEVIPLLPAER